MTETKTCGLVYEGYLPLAWEELAVAPSELDLVHTEGTNLDVLRTLFILESQSGEVSEDTSEMESETIAKLDFKLNLLLELVGQLFAQHKMIPQPSPVRLTTETIEWRDHQAPAVNSLTRIALYCTPKYPRPLVLHGQVAGVTQQPTGWSINVTFHNVSEAVQEGLERFIFVHHRRIVAQSRRHRSPPEQS